MLNSRSNLKPASLFSSSLVIILNHALVHDSGLGSLEPADVEPYLKQNLHWKVQKVISSFIFYICESHYRLQANGEEPELQSLEVVVIATLVSYPPGAILPVLGPSRRVNHITYGQAGGSRYA
jgi:tyrosinase